MSECESFAVVLSPVGHSASATRLCTLEDDGSDIHEICPLVHCKLCLADYVTDQMYSLSQCSCVFCRECVEMYIKMAITDGNVLSITCPNSFCRRQGVIEQHEIKSLVGVDMFERYMRLLFQQEIELDPARTFCPRPECRGICNVLPFSTGTVSFADDSARPIKCTTCGSQFCSWCKNDWHENQTCDENMIKSEGEIDGILFSSSEDAEIKRCPTCHVPIERNSGCAQMMCRRCKHVFCWYCLAPLDDDFLLRHYDKGRCKNKLGHSRASVIWHRTQVVGLFAGFGVLLLIVSPFLLLAMPCLLCCRCRPCRRCDELDNATDVSQPPPSS